MLASLGNFVTASSLLDATRDDLQRAFLPAVRDAGGTSVLVQGPLAFEPRPEFGTDLTLALARIHLGERIQRPTPDRHRDDDRRRRALRCMIIVRVR